MIEKTVRKMSEKEWEHYLSYLSSRTVFQHILANYKCWIAIFFMTLVLSLMVVSFGMRLVPEQYNDSLFWLFPVFFSGAIALCILIEWDRRRKLQAFKQDFRKYFTDEELVECVHAQVLSGVLLHDPDYVTMSIGDSLFLDLSDGKILCLHNEHLEQIPVDDLKYTPSCVQPEGSAVDITYIRQLIGGLILSFDCALKEIPIWKQMVVQGTSAEEVEDIVGSIDMEQMPLPMPLPDQPVGEYFLPDDCEIFDGSLDTLAEDIFRFYLKKKKEKEAEEAEERVSEEKRYRAYGPRQQPFFNPSLFFYYLAPVIVIAVAGLFLTNEQWTVNRVAGLSLLSVTLFSLLVGLANPVRFLWAFRVFAFFLCVGIAAMSYLYWAELQTKDMVRYLLPFGWIFLFGYPSFVYLATGRLPSRKYARTEE